MGIITARCLTFKKVNNLANSRNWSPTIVSYEGTIATAMPLGAGVCYMMWVSADDAIQHGLTPDWRLAAGTTDKTTPLSRHMVRDPF